MAAHRVYLDLPGVIAAAFVGSLLGDQLFFFLGRRHSQALLRRRPSWLGPVERVERIVDRYRTLFVLCFRFLYGLRTVAPFAIGGMGRIAAWKSILFNAVVWATVVGAAGYCFGHGVETVLGDVKRCETRLFAAVAAVGGIFWLMRTFRKFRKRPPVGPGGP